MSAFTEVESRYARKFAGRAKSLRDYFRHYRLKGWRRRLRFGPDIFEAVEIETLTACNRRCVYCPNAVSERGLIKNGKLMEPAVFEKIIGDLDAIGFKGRLSPHFYGEPLLDERLVDMLRYATERLPGVFVNIFTNGDFLDSGYYRRLVAAGVRQFTITQHGPTMPRAVQDMYAYRERAGDQGVAVVYRAYSADSELDNRGGLIEHPTYIRRDKCFNPSRELIIDHRGDVVLCCNDYFSTITFGNVMERSIIEIWGSARMQAIRHATKEGHFELEICRKCVGSG